MSKTCGCDNERLPLASVVAMLTASDTVAEASRYPEAREALSQFGVNHCCGAHLTLAEAAAAAGVPPGTLLAAVNAARLARARTA